MIGSLDVAYDNPYKKTEGYSQNMDPKPYIAVSRLVDSRIMCLSTPVDSYVFCCCLLYVTRLKPLVIFNHQTFQVPKMEEYSPI